MFYWHTSVYIYWQGGGESMGKKPRQRTAVHGADLSDAALLFEVVSNFTLSDLAEALSPITPDTAATAQRIRHWTREGVLRPAAQEHAGRGKHRQYSTDAVYEAAVLQVMTSSGLPVAYSLFIPDALEIVRANAAKWIAARRKGQMPKLPALIIGMTKKAKAQVGQGELKDTGGFKTADVVLKIEIDLTKIFMEVDSGRS